MQLIVVLLSIFLPLVIYGVLNQRSRQARWRRYELARLERFAEELAGQLRHRPQELDGATIQGTLDGKQVHLHIGSVRPGEYQVRLGVAVDRGLNLRLELPTLLGRLRRAFGVGDYLKTGSAADAQVVVSSPTERDAQTLFEKGGAELQRVLSELLTYTKDIVAADGWLYLDYDPPELDPAYLRWLLVRMVDLARFYDRRRIHVRGLDTEGFAWIGGGGNARCPYCREGIDEGDLLVTVCDSCRTVQHVACFEEHGACSIYGCQGKAQGRVRIR